MVVNDKFCPNINKQTTLITIKTNNFKIGGNPKYLELHYRQILTNQLKNGGVGAGDNFTNNVR